MANEIELAHTATGATLYAVVRSAVGTVVKVSDGSLVTYATASLTARKKPHGA